MMEHIKKKLEKIADVWNHYILDLRYFQKKINFTPDVQTNYFGDILRYFEDTFDLLKIRRTKAYRNHVFSMIGLLQVIYIQQDLMDELLYIFKIHKSLPADKNQNRELRNELVGHPIRRKKDAGNELVSSVFFGRDLSPENIHYILYSRKNDFKGDSTSHSTSEIINRHNAFLEKYFTQIIAKLNKLILAYKEILITIDAMVNKKVSFPKIVTIVDQCFEKIADDNYLFKKKILLSCYERRDEHPRYQLTADIFIATLRRYLKDTFSNIDGLLKRDTAQPKKKKFNLVKINIQFSDAKHSNLTEQQKEDNYVNYELSKLHGRKHPIYNIDYFRTTFHDNEAILVELTNMENNLNNNLEYYSSFEYIAFLLGKSSYRECIRQSV